MGSRPYSVWDGYRYWWVSVSLVYRSIWIVVPSRMTVVSRNDSCSIEISAVNLMVWWKELICRKFSSRSRSYCQMVKMSPMKHHHK